MARESGSGIASLAQLASVSRVLLAVQVVIDALLALAGLVILFYTLTSPYGVIYAAESNARVMLPAVLVSGLLGLLFLLILVITTVVFLLWVHRGWSNLYEAGLDGLNFTPGWAAGSFLVPFVNLVLPLRSMRELANRSAGEDVWQIMQPVPDVSSWWSCLLAGTFLRLIALAVAMVDRIPYIYVTTPPAATMGISLFASLLLAASAWFLRRAIGEITANQKAMRHASGAFD